MIYFFLFHLVQILTGLTLHLSNNEELYPVISFVIEIIAVILIVFFTFKKEYFKNIIQKTAKYFSMYFLLLFSLTVIIFIFVNVLAQWNVFEKINFDFPDKDYTFEKSLLTIKLSNIIRHVVSPLKEEFFYRVILITFFIKYLKNKYIAMILSSLIFMSFHLCFSIDIFVGGLFLSWLYLKEKNMYLCYFNHLLHNIVVLAIKYYMAL